ncbi:hypothetical protein H9Q70_013957, partial [Fusarium xylarioides]
KKTPPTAASSASKAFLKPVRLFLVNTRTLIISAFSAGLNNRRSARSAKLSSHKFATASMNLSQRHTPYPSLRQSPEHRKLNIQDSHPIFVPAGVTFTIVHIPVNHKTSPPARVLQMRSRSGGMCIATTDTLNMLGRIACLGTAN